MLSISMRPQILYWLWFISLLWNMLILHNLPISSTFHMGGAILVANKQCMCDPELWRYVLTKKAIRKFGSNDKLILFIYLQYFAPFRVLSRFWWVFKLFRWSGLFWALLAGFKRFLAKITDFGVNYGLNSIWRIYLQFSSNSARYSRQ